MTAACSHPLPLYRPRDPQESDLRRLMDRHFDTFQRGYDERFQAKYKGHEKDRILLHVPNDRIREALGAEDA